jgi:hypothetical protein
MHRLASVPRSDCYNLSLSIGCYIALLSLGVLHLVADCISTDKFFVRLVFQIVHCNAVAVSLELPFYDPYAICAIIVTYCSCCATRRVYSRPALLRTRTSPASIVYYRVYFKQLLSFSVRETTETALRWFRLL